MEQHANTSAASIPLALAVAVDDGRIKNGDVVAMEAIGGGLVWGAALVKFGNLAKFMEIAKLEFALFQGFKFHVSLFCLKRINLLRL